MITCETPHVPPASFVVGYDYNVHSTITYHCDPGYIMRGEPMLKCLETGEWDNEAPDCRCKSKHRRCAEFIQLFPIFQSSIASHSPQCLSGPSSISRTRLIWDRRSPTVAPTRTDSTAFPDEFALKADSGATQRRNAKRFAALSRCWRPTASCQSQATTECTVER